MAGKTITYQGEKCYYRVAGRGKPVMLVHGFMEDSFMWAEPAKALQRNFKLIIPDLPGFGKSIVKNWEQATGREGLTMDWYAGYIKAIADAEKLKYFTLLGHSMGGYITLHFAANYAERLKSIGLINSHCFADTEEKKENRRKGIELVRRHGTSQFTREIYDAMFYATFLKKNKTLVNKLVERAGQYAPEAVMRANAAMMNRAPQCETLKNARVPVLMVGGKEDGSAPLEYVLKQTSYPAICDIQIFSHCKHMCVFEKKKETIAAIKDFCNRW